MLPYSNLYLMYFVVFSIGLSFVIFLLLIIRNKGKLQVEVINPSQAFELKKIKVVEGSKINYEKVTIPILPKNIFLKGSRTRKVYLNSKTMTLLSFSDIDETSELGSTWTRKEIDKHIKKQVAKSKQQAKLFDTTPLIIILLMLGVNIALLFMIANKLGVFK